MSGDGYAQAFIRAMDSLPPSLGVADAGGNIDVDATAHKIIIGARWILAERERQKNRPNFREGMVIGLIIGCGVTAITALIIYGSYFYERK